MRRQGLGGAGQPCRGTRTRSCPLMASFQDLNSLVQTSAARIERTQTMRASRQARSARMRLHVCLPIGSDCVQCMACGCWLLHWLGQTTIDLLLRTAAQRVTATANTVPSSGTSTPSVTWGPSSSYRRFQCHLRVLIVPLAPSTPSTPYSWYSQYGWHPSPPLPIRSAAHGLNSFASAPFLSKQSTMHFKGDFTPARLWILLRA